MTPLKILDSKTEKIDEYKQLLKSGRYVKGHPSLTLPAGIIVTLEVVSQDFYPMIFVTCAHDESSILLEDLNPNSTTKAQVTIESREGGSYSVAVSTTNPGRTGSYTINLYEGRPSSN